MLSVGIDDDILTKRCENLILLFAVISYVCDAMLSQAKEWFSFTKHLISATLLHADLFPEHNVKFPDDSGGLTYAGQGQALNWIIPDLCSRLAVLHWLCSSFSWRTTFKAP